MEQSKQSIINLGAKSLLIYDHQTMEICLRKTEGGRTDPLLSLLSTNKT